ncbi:DinB family protein [Deinococcus pimensis]|uniref:DinB family protein n=1 Tax=Deinococcus pimensis TaxID=309888 RepID=UPI0004BB820D|nr:DinB family protein [Deinococcus pimensis]
MTTPTTEAPVLTASDFLTHWQGHRDLTRRTIEVFPQEHLFTFSPEGTMRPFGAMMLEVVGMMEPTLRFLVEGEWKPVLSDLSEVTTKEALLRAWDDATDALREQWARVPPQRLWLAVPVLPHLSAALYLVDNEVHHRAQGFVYLRLLGVRPPAFWERTVTGG